MRPNMQMFLHLVRSDARRLLKTPSVPLLWLAFPLALSLIEYGAFGQIGRTPNGLPKGTLLLVDYDRSLLSGVFAQALTHEPLADFFDVVRLDTTNVFEKKLANNDGSAALLLPRGFQDSVVAGARVGLTYVPNPRQQIRPAMIDASLRTFMDIGNRFLHEAQDALALVRSETKVAGAPSRASVLAISAAFYDAGQHFTKLGALQDLDLKMQRPAPKPGQAAASGDTVNFFAYFLPGLLLFSLLMVSQGFERRAFALRERGLARRVIAAPVGAGTVLAAEAGGVLIASLVTGAVILLLGGVLFKIPLHQPLVIGVTLVGFSLYAVGLMKTLYGAAKTKRSAEALGSVVTLLSTLIGGGFAPIEIYADSVQPFAAATPVGCASSSMVNAIVHNQGFAVTAPHVLGIWAWAAGFCVIGFVLSWRNHARR
jgi:ABC-type multidrug transport system permease subunit